MSNYRRDGSRSGQASNLAGLAGNDQMDTFNLLMGASSAFFCNYTVADPLTLSAWNGIDDLAGIAGADSGDWRCLMQPSFDLDAVPTEPLRFIGIGSDVTIAAAAHAIYQTSFAGSTITVEWFDSSDSSVLTSANIAGFTFWVLAVGPRRNFEEMQKNEALDGGRA